MTTKFLVEKLFNSFQINQFHRSLIRSVSTTSIRSNAKVVIPDFPGICSSPNQVAPRIITPTCYAADPRISYKNSRELHADACLMDDNSGAAKQSNVTYSVVPRERSRIISQFLLRFYHQLEPISVALGMPVKEVDGWFHRFINLSMSASMLDVSIQAIDESARRRVGVLASIVIDPKNKLPPTMSSFLDPTKHPINITMMEFFEKLETGLNKCGRAGVTEDGDRPVKILEHMFINTDPSYANQGISSKMLNVCEALASSVINCKIGYVVTTSEYSYKVFTKHGYQVAKELAYKDYVDSKGVKIFEDKMDKLEPHFTCRAMVKKLDDYYK